MIRVCLNDNCFVHDGESCAAGSMQPVHCTQYCEGYRRQQIEKIALAAQELT